MSTSEIVLPAPTGSALEGESLSRLEKRLGGRRIGVVGDLPLWGPETLLSVVALAAAGLFRMGALSAAMLAITCALCGVVAAGQMFGVGLLNFLFPRRPSWAVVVGRLDRLSPMVIAIPTDKPATLLPLARLVLAITMAIVPHVSLPLAAGLQFAGPAILLLRRRTGPEVSAEYRLASESGQPDPPPIVLCGASRRDARGLLGALDWLDAGQPVVLWVAGAGGSCDILPRSAPWRMTSEAARQLLDPAVLRLWLRGFEVRVVGARPVGGDLTLAIRRALPP